MPQYIRQMDQVLINPIIGIGKQMPEIMGIYLLLRDAGLSAQPLHLRPYIAAVHGHASRRDKHRTGSQAVITAIRTQAAPQFFNHEDGSEFPFIIYFHPPRL